MHNGPNGRSAFEAIHGYTPNIAEYADFTIWSLLWYYDPTDKNDPERLGRWLGVADEVGNDLTYWVLTSSGKIIATSTCSHVTQADYRNPDCKARIDAFNERVLPLCDINNHAIKDLNPDIPEALLHMVRTISATDTVDNDELPTTPNPRAYGDMICEDRLDVDDVIDGDHVDGYNKFLRANLVFEQDGELKRGTVKKIAKNVMGERIGKYNPNPILDTTEYVVGLSDGSEEIFLASQIAQNLYSQVDEEGKQYLLIEEIIDHRKDNSAIPISDGYVLKPNGDKIPKKTT